MVVPPRLRNAMQNFSKGFSSVPPPQVAPLIRATPLPPLSLFTFFLFFFPSPLSFHNLLRDSNALIFHVSSLGPDFHGFLDIAGSTTFFLLFFFSTPSSKMEGIKTRDTLMPSPRAGLHPLNNDFAKSRV